MIRQGGQGGRIGRQGRHGRKQKINYQLPITNYQHTQQYKYSSEHDTSNLAPGNMDVKTTTTCKVGKVFNI
ncbi:MAG: hypothetical protein C4323_10900, partial [Mastigocladus sp. ERB_26_2]